MKKYSLLLLLPGLIVAGCGLPESKKIEYKSAAKLPSLEVPPDLTVPSRDERYAVPDISTKNTATFSAYAGERGGDKRVSAPGDVLPAQERMRIERAGTQRWLVVGNSQPDALWPKLKEFWHETGLTVVIDSPQTGIMETDWAENRAKVPQDFLRSTIGKLLDSVYSTAERDKFRTRVEKGADGSTEIYISHRGVYETYINEGRSETRWQPRPADLELEAEMLRRLMVRLGASEERAKAVVAASDAKLAERAKLDKGGGKTALSLEEPFDRAWRRVGLALDRVGFTVEDRDRAQGMYFVRYVDPEADASKKAAKGFVDKLMFWKDGKADALAAAQFRIRVEGKGETSTVTVMTREGGEDQSETSSKILNLLFDQLK